MDASRRRTDSSSCRVIERKLSSELFKQRQKDVQIRCLKQRHAEVAEEAREKGLLTEQVIDQQGFKDVVDFNRHCPKFSLMCQTEDLAELGSGFVLYFQLLKFMVFMLFLLVLFQIPVVAYYGGQNAVARWEHVRDWEAGFKRDYQPCGCTSESNNGQGGSCRAWDLQACLAASPSGPHAKRGKWCCRSWCFASPSCPERTNKESASLSSRQYRSLIRASEACTQNETLLRTACAGFEDVAFPGDGSLNTIRGRFIGSFWLTPGNFGPDSADQVAILVMYFMLVFIFSVATILMHEYQLVAEARIDSQTVMPNDFAIMVKGLPTTATEEEEIANFFMDNAVPGRTTEIVKVVIGFDVGEVKHKLRELKDARQELDTVLMGGSKNSMLSLCGLSCCQSEDADVTNSREVEEIKKRIADIKKHVEELKPGETAIASSGIAVVVFRKQQDMRACVSRWNRYRSWINGGNNQPLFGGQAVRVRVQRAANPQDIHWEELGHSFAEKLKLSVWYSFLMLVLIVLGFLATWGLNQGQIALKQQSQEKYGTKSGYALQAASLLPAAVVSLINVALRAAGRHFGDREYQDTLSEQERAQFTKMSFAMLANTSLVILVLNYKTTDWYEKGGLVDDVFFLLVMDAFFRLSLIVDYTWLFNFHIRRQVTTTWCDKQNAVIQDNHPPKTFEQQEKLEEVKVRIEGCRSAFEPEEFDNPDRYARALTTFLTACFYAPLFPMAALLGIIALLLQYGIDKLVLLRWSKRSRPQNAVQALWCVNLVKMMAPLAVTSGVVIFLMPSWTYKKQVFNFFLLSLVMSVCVAVGPFRCWSWAFLCRCCTDCQRNKIAQQVGDEDYYSAQYKWPKELKYHMDQFLYKQLHRSNKKKNPEFLNRGTDHASKVGDLQSHLGDAVRQTAENTSKKQGRNKAVRAFVGDRVVDTADGTGGRFMEYSAKEDASATPCVCIRPGCERPTWNGMPGTFCGRTCREKATGTMKGAVPVPERGAAQSQPLLPAAVVPTLLPETVGCPAHARGHWEYETGHGFTCFAADCQETLEEQYQAFQNGTGSDRVTVETDGHKISIDFQKMTQMVEGSRNVRKIQRKERE